MNLAVDVELGALAAAAGAASFTAAAGTPRVAPHALAADASLLIYLCRLANTRDPFRAVSLTATWPSVGLCLAGAALAGWGRARVALVVAAFSAWGLAVARWGYLMAAAWPLPVLAPQILAAGLSFWFLRRAPRDGDPWARAGAVVLPCSAVADLATAWSGAPDPARAALGAVTWFVFSGTVMACRLSRASSSG